MFKSKIHVLSYMYIVALLSLKSLEKVTGH